MIVEALQRILGAKRTLQVDQHGALLVAQAKPSLYDLVDQGLVYAGQTAVGGVAPGTAVGTAPPITLYNPPNSDVKLVVLKVSMGYISGTLGAGTVLYVGNFNPVAAVVTGTAISVVNLKLGTKRVDGGNKGQLFTTSTLPATPTLLRPFMNLDASLATSVVGPYRVTDEPNGESVLTPNSALSLQGVAAAGTAPLVAFGFAWAELPL